jgi:c-di-GMP-binding flagellar brake protein YcgR
MKIENSDFNKGKRIAIELGTQLQVQVNGVDFNFKSNLIGIESNNYLIIDTPVTLPNISIKYKFYRGNKIVVRYLYKGTVFGFESELIDIYSPLRLLFVKYPNVIEQHNLRSQERVDCFFPVKIKSSNGQIDGTILDISKGGCRCVAKGNAKDKELLLIKIDEEITLRCNFPMTEGEQLVLGKVKAVKSDTKQMTLGIMFHKIEPELQDIIDKYILTIKELHKPK